MYPPNAGDFALHLIDVGQGESILIDFPNGDFALVDAGPSSALNSILAPIAARWREGRRFRFAAMTHWDADHIGALSRVISAHPPVELVRPNIDLSLIERVCERYEMLVHSAVLRELLEASRGIDERPLGARQGIPDIGTGVEIWALSPAGTVRRRIEEAAKDPRRMAFRRLRNAASLVLWIRVFGRTLLLPGEVDADAASELEEQFGGPEEPGRIHHDDPRAVWIKLSHHGSKTGTDANLLRLFGHETFVASASHGARHGHPHPLTLHAVRENNGLTMCTRLGKGCRLIQEHPTEYPAHDPSWSAKVDWDEQASLQHRCYGTITVTITPAGRCTVTGAVAERPDCPFGGPPTGRISLPD